MRVLYIAGFGRSGSTLLAQLLHQVDGVDSVGELHHIWRTGAVSRAQGELCGCGVPYAVCPFWNRALDRSVLADERDAGPYLDLKQSVDRIRYLPWMLSKRPPAGYRTRLQRYVSVWESLYAALGAEAGGSVLVDSSKDVSPLFLLSRLPELEVRVVHLLRDPRGASYSWSKRPKRRPEFPGEEVRMKRYSAWATGLRWLYTNLLVERARAVHPHYLQVRYEDLVADPAAGLRTILETVGRGEAPLTFLTERTAQIERRDHSVSGNPVRFRQGPVEIRADDAWRQEMPFLSRWGVTAITAPLLGRYGYRGSVGESFR